jgi:aminoglycoside phosphotransferase (APT) family kinase protein
VSTGKSSSEKVDIDGSLVRWLIARQFSRWADLPLTKVRSAGTDHAIYRLGDDMVVRLPRLPAAANMVDNEQQWLPRLAPLLPLAVPEPLGKGAPDDWFPYPWSVYRWLPGKDLADQPDVDLHEVAVRLGRFVAALQRIESSGGPPSRRAKPVSTRDDGAVRSTIRQLATDQALDAEVATAVWDQALAAPVWHGRPVWIHGDLFPTNLLARQGRLTAVIDFGLLGLGDPACDMLPAWTLLTAETRGVFRAESGVDDATWVRGRGWALSAGLGAVRVYRHTNPVLAAAGQHAIEQSVADHRRTA